jgi:HD-GYP domain-containing protein (c-di-GMP phosphodiesterase class II)
VHPESDRAPARLAELAAALSLGIDLGFAQPMEHALRECLIALRIADQLGLDQEARAAVYYTGLLLNVGCHSDAYEQAKWFGDDIALKATKYEYPLRGVRGTAAMMRMLGSGHPPVGRLRMCVLFAISGRRDVEDMISGHARIAQVLATQLALRPEVVDAIGNSYEFWDGHGWPQGSRGDAIPLPARIVALAEFVEVANRNDGAEAAKDLARDRSGEQFDPALAELFCTNADVILADLESVSTWQAVVDSEPALGEELPDLELDAALAAIANFVDLKSPYFLGHAQSMAALCEQAAIRLGLPTDEAVVLRRSALVQGLGRLGISNGVLDKTGPLGPGEWERIRLHPYLTERMLQASPALAPLGAVAGQARERLDGSGYPRGLSGSTISRAGRVLGVVDAYCAMREPRPHRAALSADDAAISLRGEVRAGRMDAQAVDAVLGAAGLRVPVRTLGPAGLTPREVEVLRLLARGLSNKEIGLELVISPKTARNHVEHIYAKINASSRAAASLYAMQHGLLYDAEPATAGG